MNKESMTIQLKTLTPIWTGDAYGKCSEIKESNIIGTIRWWYERVSRSLGKQVCTPTLQSEDKKCKLNGEQFIRSIREGKTIDTALDEQNICPVCKLFGCNGWSSKLKLVVKYDDCKDISGKVYVRGRKSGKAKRKVQGKMFNENNPLTLEFYPVKEITDEEWKILAFVIKLILKWAALGARTAQGNGVVEIINEDVLEENELNDLAFSSYNFPDLTDFFFVKYRLEFNEDISKIISKNVFCIDEYQNKNSDHEGLKDLWNDHKFIPIGFHIRDIIRRVEENEDKRHELFGVVTKKNKKMIQKGSKIFVSHGYKINSKTVECRIWGYGVGENKREFVNKLQNKINDELNNYLFKPKCKNENENKNDNNIHCNISYTEYMNNSLKV